MNTWLWISLAVNVGLGVALTVVFRAFRHDRRWADKALRHEREQTQQTLLALERLTADHCALGAGVAQTLRAIREDIDRNYHHTHDGHVLDMLAHRLTTFVAMGRGDVHEVDLDQYCAKQVEALGGKVSDRCTMSLGQMLDFAWRLHARSRERSDQLMPVVSQPCGNTDHAGWLSKTLAIYELMCGRDKELAVKRLTAVVDSWRYTSEHTVARYVEDIR
ncbi:hypothetical protein [Ralstonia insidiosa]|mgnify:CR=1 FL=1|jgi:hypothetical protein|nr:hypothetical protein [Ralstonia insidiosa]MBA9939331.1 hypothetical protein [Ralstonia insidiosa]MBC9968102.1 hypothetical protein [Ralstonia insidiosa]MBX3904335.1 hypothetical protein [Ralstonia insidiosa]